MIKLNYFVVCENVINDSSTNNLSFINVYDTINAPRVPAIHPLMYLVISVGRRLSIEQSENYSLKIFLKSPSGAESENPAEINGSIPENSINARNIIRIEGTPISEFGNNELIVRIKDGRRWIDLGSYSLLVKQNPE